MTNLGIKARGRLLHHDVRSRDYEASRRAVKPVSWLHTMGPVLDQGQISGCTGWTGADFLNSAKAIGNRRRYNKTVAHRQAMYLADADGLSLYRQATEHDQFGWVYPPTDQGSSGLGVAKALKALGVIDAYLWTFSFDQLLAWGVKQPIMLGTLWTEAMSDPDAKGTIHIGSPAQIRSAVDANEGHEYSLRGVNWPRKLARIRNHWTDDWGIKGEALIPLAELETLIIAHQGDVCVPQVVAK